MSDLPKNPTLPYDVKEAPLPDKPASAPKAPRAVKLSANMSFQDVIDNQCYQPMEFEDSLDLLLTYHPAMQNDEIAPYIWQIETSAQLCEKDKYNKALPLMYYLVAANGSGKDAYVISTFATWFIFTKIRARVVITSSSHTQLKNQTESYIKTWCGIINAFYREDDRGQPFIINSQHIRCRWTGAEIMLFATDEEGKAEGYHPHADYPNGELAVIINEGKSVRDEIFTALARCTFTHWIVVSSPGKDSGHLFTNFMRADKFPAPIQPAVPYGRRVTAYDCPHFSPQRLSNEEKLHGRNSLYFRSARLAEFTSQDEDVVLSMEDIRKCLLREKIPHVPYGRRAGLDLALGGDECAFYCFDGNKYVGKKTWKMKNPKATAEYCIEVFKSFGFTKETAKDIIADHGGIGQGLDAFFQDKGWHLTWVMNQSKARRVNSFCANLGAEMWMNVKHLIEQCLIILPPEEEEQTLYSQLSSRYYTQHKISGKLVLEAKAEAKAKGHGSPDRADAMVLAFLGMTPDELRHQLQVLAGKVITPVVATYKGKPKPVNELADKYDEIRYASHFPQNRTPVKQAGKRTPYGMMRNKIEPWKTAQHQTSPSSKTRRNTSLMSKVLGRPK